MEGIWPLVILWLLFSIFGAKKKKPDNRQSAVGSGQSEGKLGLPDQFRLALEELKRAEMEARGKERRQIAQVFHPKPLPAPVAEVADDEPSSEDTSTVEGLADYDHEAEQIALARRMVADRPAARRSGSVEEMSAAQAARRGARVDVAIGGKAEHDAWHVQMLADGAVGQEGPVARKHPLAKYADGTLRGALIIGEILGKPKGER